jgi:uncharacterized membrane protein YfcA
MLFLAATAVVAGLVKGFTGFGGALVMATLFTLVLSPSETLGTVVIVNVATAWQLLRPSWRMMQRNVVLPMAAASALATPVGVAAVLLMNPLLGREIIGLGVLCCGLVLISGWRRQHPARFVHTIAVGLVGGLLNGLAGIGGPPAALWILAGRDGAERDRAGLLVYVALTQAATAIIATGAGALDLAVLIRSLWLAPLYLAGTAFGARLFRVAPEESVRFGVITLIISLGAATAVR